MDGFGTNSGKTKLFNTKLIKVEPNNFPKNIYVNKINSIFTILFYLKLNLLKKLTILLIKFIMIKLIYLITPPIIFNFLKRIEDLFRSRVNKKEK